MVERLPSIFDVKQFLNSTTEVGQDNSSVMNVYQNKYRHIKLPYLATTATGAYDSSKKNYWFLVAMGMGTNGWQAYHGMWEAPNLKPVSENGANADYSRDIWTYGVRAGYGICTVSPRGLIGSLAS